MQLVSRGTSEKKPEPEKQVICGRCNKPKHIGGCRGVTKARHSKSWKATR